MPEPARPLPPHTGSGEPVRDTRSRVSKFDWIRWAAALGVAVAGLLFFLDAIHDQSVCKQTLGNESPTPVEICGPPRLLDLAPFALVIALLLWHDLSEFRLSGLFSLSRRVEQQEIRQAAVERQIVELHQTVAQSSASQAQSQSTTTTINAYYAPDQDDVRRGIQEKEEQEQAGASTEEPRETAPAGEGPEGHDHLIGAFLKAYAQLEPYIDLGGPRGVPRSTGDELAELGPDQREAIAEWNEMFRPEISALRQTRNVVVHEPHMVSHDTLRGAIDNTHELSRILSGRLTE